MGRPPIFGAEGKERFLAALARRGVLKLACAETGAGAGSVYHARKTDPASAARVKEALAEAGK